ncbi:MAG TPA: hypothetical protein VN253_13700 [Kofleriaceae bacterium]|nr:hypothetical protein [Kofleriaceae bacterium]
MRSGLALICTLAACTFGSPPSAEPDAGADPVPMPDACASFSSQLDTCALEHQIPLELSGDLMFDTDTGVLTRNGASVTVVSKIVPTLGGEVRALLATSVLFRNTARLRAVGTRGFAIVASGSITLQAGAVIDVSTGGAGARATCDSGPARGGNDDGGAAGGGGGGFGAKGGDGGNGDSDQGESTGGRGGDAAATPPPGPIGGCTGAGGGDQSAANPGGAPGLGGGAVFLVSNATIGISVGAGIQAGGGGGAGGTRTTGNGDAGGGGGGSGGMIFLEARVVRSDGILAANGGGGGQGSGNGAAGMPGTPGRFGIDLAPGGQGGGSSGTDGAAGGHRASLPGATPTNVGQGAGGGGGGGVGILRVVSPDQQLGALVSPAPT